MMQIFNCKWKCSRRICLQLLQSILRTKDIFILLLMTMIIVTMIPVQHALRNTYFNIWTCQCNKGCNTSLSSNGNTKQRRKKKRWTLIIMLQYVWNMSFSHKRCWHTSLIKVINIKWPTNKNTIGTYTQYSSWTK